MAFDLLVQSQLSAMNAAVQALATFIGLDLGQRANYTALVILERLDLMPSHTDMLRGIGARRFHIVRQAERIRLGTTYPEVVKHVKALVERVVSKRGSCTLVVDGSGVGVPVVDMMRATGMGCRVRPISITGGDHATESSVPRVHLITKMQMMAQSGELKIAPGCRNGEDLERELLHLQVEGKSARSGEENDDLALALALACWLAKPR